MINIPNYSTAVHESNRIDVLNNTGATTAQQVRPPRLRRFMSLFTGNRNNRQQPPSLRQANNAKGRISKQRRLDEMVQPRNTTQANRSALTRESSFNEKRLDADPDHIVNAALTARRERGKQPFTSTEHAEILADHATHRASLHTDENDTDAIIRSALSTRQARGIPALTTTDSPRLSDKTDTTVEPATSGHNRASIMHTRDDDEMSSSDSFHSTMTSFPSADEIMEELDDLPVTVDHEQPVSGRFIEDIHNTELLVPASSNSTAGEISEAAETIVLDAAQQTQPANIRQLTGQDGFFYFLTPHGDLHRYDPTVNEVLETPLQHVNHIAMGANQKLYAHIGQQIVQLHKNGTIKTEYGNMPEIPHGIQDMAIGGAGRQAFLLNREGQLFQHRLGEPQTALQDLRLPINVSASTPRSVATGSNGDLWLLGADNQVWQGRLSTDGYDWQAVDTPPQRLQNLETLPDGTVAGRDSRDQLLAANPNTSIATRWQPVPFQMLARSPFQRMHGALEKQNATELITFLGGTATIRPFSMKTLTQPFKSLGNVAKSIPRLYRDLKHFDYSKQQDESFGRFQAQANSFWRLMKEQPLLTQPLTDELKQRLDRGLGQQISHETLTLLDRIDVDIDDHPELRSHLKIPKKITADTEENVLEKLKNIRTALYGHQDAVAAKLDQMIADGLYITMDMAHFQGSMAKLVADHAILNDAALSLMEHADAQSHQQTITQARAVRNNSLPHLLFRSGIAHSDPTGNAAQGFDALQAIFRQQADMLPRIVQKYAPAITGTPVEISSMEAAADLFGRMVNTMQPGDSISFGKGTTNGFNTETFRLVLSGAWTSISGSSVVSWVIPVVDIGKLKGVGLAITKTNDGIDININRSRGKYTQLGIRTGIGCVGLPKIIPEKIGQCWGFQGWEIAVKAKHSNNTTDTISLSLKDQGNGNIQKTIASIMTGQADIFELMKASTDTTSSHTDAKAFNVNVGNVGVLASGSTMPGWNSNINGIDSLPAGAASIDDVWNHIHTRDTIPVIGHAVDGVVAGMAALRAGGKVLAAIVPEVALDFGSKQATTVATSSNGKVTTSENKQKFGLQGVRGNIIGVGVLETDYANQVMPVDTMIGQDTSSPNLTGRAGIPSFLPGAILGKSFNNLAPENKTVSLVSSANGNPESINVQLTVNRTSTLEQNINKYSELSQQVPGLKKAVDALLRQQGKEHLNFNLPVSISMELKPELLRNLPAARKERQQVLQNFARDIENFRVTSMSVSDTHQAAKAKVIPVPAWTREMSAVMNATTDFARVAFIYDRNTVINQAKETLRELHSFSDGVWGTRDRQQRLTQLNRQLENLINALGQGPLEWKHGKTLENHYRQQLNAVKQEFTARVNNLLTGKVSTRQQDEAFAAMDQLAEAIVRLRRENHIPPFEGPAMITSGPLFINPSVGQLQPENSLKRFKDINLKKTTEMIAEFGRINLSALSGKRLEKATRKVNEDIDHIKRTLNSASDIDQTLKNDFLAELAALPAGPTTRSDLATILHKLDKLAPRD